MNDETGRNETEETGNNVEKTADTIRCGNGNDAGLVGAGNGCNPGDGDGHGGRGCSCDPADQGDDGKGIPGNVQQPAGNVNGNYESKKQAVIRELDSLSAAIETGEAIMVEARGGPLMTRAAGKKPSVETGMWYFSVVYKEGRKK